MVFFIYSKGISQERKLLQKSGVRAEYREGTTSCGTSSLEGRWGVRNDYPTSKACEPESAEMARTELQEEAETRKLFQAEGTAHAKL